MNLSPLNIKRLRELRGLTRKHVEHTSCVKLRTYISYETGERTPPLSTAKRIADALGCSVDDLMKNEDST